MKTSYDRKTWMSLLATAPAELLETTWDHAGFDPDFSTLRKPEIGSVMVRGRLGGGGAAFNMGEMTVTRCSVQLREGVVGHSYVQGRDKEKAQLAALADAMMQTDLASEVQLRVLDPLQKAKDARKTERAEKAAATKVEFFTLVRGE